MSVVSPHTISATLVMLVFMYTSMFSTGLSFSPFSLCIFIFRHPNSVYFLNEIFYFYPEKAEEWKKLFCVWKKDVFFSHLELFCEKTIEK